MREGDPALARRARLGLVPPRQTQVRRPGRYGMLAVAAHVAFAGALLLLPRLAGYFHLGTIVPPPPPPATIEMIQQDTPSVGSSTRRDAARAASPEATVSGGSPSPLSSDQSPDAVAASSAQGPATRMPKASRATAPEAEQASMAMPEVNLDLPEVDDPGTGLVEGDVIPASPDARHPNLPPPYPPQAEARREEGTVGLIIDVAPDGHPAHIEIASSSGYPILDAAARRAVERWHFRPGVQDGKPAPSIFNQQITFEIGERR